MKAVPIALVVLTVGMVGVTASSSYAKSKSVKQVVREQIREACGNRGGTITRKGVIRRDLNGDRRKDLIVDHSCITCRSGRQRSLACGMQVCSTIYYVRTRHGYKAAGDFLGSILRIGKGRRPGIRYYGHGDRRFTVRWSRGKFRTR